MSILFIISVESISGKIYIFVALVELHRFFIVQWNSIFENLCFM